MLIECAIVSDTFVIVMQLILHFTRSSGIYFYADLTICLQKNLDAEILC